MVPKTGERQKLVQGVLLYRGRDSQAKKHCRNLCSCRKTWCVITKWLEAQSGKVWELKTTGVANHSGYSNNIVRFTSRSSTSLEKTREKNLVLPAGGCGKEPFWNTTECSSFFFNLVLIEKDNRFTILCWFLSYNTVNQPQVYTFPLSLEPPSRPPAIPPSGLSQSAKLCSLCYTTASH